MPTPDTSVISIPMSLEAERTVLGAVLVDPVTQLPKTASLTRGDFYLEAHRIIFSYLQEMTACGIPIDLLTLVESLRTAGDLDRVGGPPYITSLTDGVPRLTNVEYYCVILKTKARERRMLVSLSNAMTLYRAGEPGLMAGALEDLKLAIEQIETSPLETEISRWRTVNCSNEEDWRNVPEIEWCCEQMIPRGSFGFVGGGPKDGKSPLIIDLCIQMAQAQYLPPGAVKFLDRFIVHGEKVLYVAKEDDLRRLKARWPDINASYGYHDPPDLTFLPRKLTTMDLTKSDHLQYLSNAIERDRFSFIVLDVLSELIPYIDELKESNQVISSLKRIQEQQPCTFTILDHIRKPEQSKSGRAKQEPNPFELRSILRKYGASDYVLMLARTKKPNELILHYECKDSGAAEDLVIVRSDFNTPGPKHKICATVAEMAREAHARGEESTARILTAVPEEWSSPGEITQALRRLYPGFTVTDRTIQRHLATLVTDLHIEVRGQRRDRQYRRIPIYEEESQANSH